MIPVIIGAIGSLSRSFQKYFDDTPGIHSGVDNNSVNSTHPEDNLNVVLHSFKMYFPEATVK
jgi:hypothetical protein